MVFVGSIDATASNLLQSIVVRLFFDLGSLSVHIVGSILGHVAVLLRPPQVVASQEEIVKGRSPPRLSARVMKAIYTPFHRVVSWVQCYADS